MNQICVGRGQRHLKKKRGVKAPALMFWKLSFMTSLWRCLRSTTLACWQCTSLLACLPLPFFFFSSTFSHTHTRLRGKNDLSAALNSLHFYKPEWTGSTKGDIIFSGFDWPPPCHRMTSCPPPLQTHHNLHQHTTNPLHPLRVLGCWVAKTTEFGPNCGAGLGSILRFGSP